jgi:hypothetical protein
MRPFRIQSTLILTAIIVFDLFNGAWAASVGKATVHSTTIVDATVVSSKAVEWSASSSYRSCGFEHELRVTETLDGDDVPSLTIGSPNPLVPGSRYLFHLNERAGGFSTNRKDAWPEDIQRNIDECLAKLPLLKVSWPPASRIINLPEPMLVLSGHWKESLNSKYPATSFDVIEIEFDTGPNSTTNHDLKCKLLREACSKQSVVVWSEFRKWIKSLLQDKANKSLNTDASDAGAG